MSQGVAWTQTWETTREKYLLPPQEEDYDDFEGEEPQSQESSNRYTEVMRVLKKVEEIILETQSNQPIRSLTAKDRKTAKINDAALLGKPCLVRLSGRYRQNT